MSITFHPKAGQILLADFSDLREPEMTKTRPVVIVSPKLPFRSQLVAMVPISLTAPRHDLPYCFRLSRNYHPLEADDIPCWVKADMVSNIALRRLNGFRTGHRQWSVPQMSEEDFRGVRRAVLYGLGYRDLAVEL